MSEPRDPPTPSRLEVLEKIPLFSSLDRRELERVSTLFSEALFHRGDLVCREGEEGDTFYLVLHGELEVTTGGEPDAGDPPEVRGYLRRGDFFGEMSLLMGGERTATVKASRRSILLALDRQSFDLHFRNNPKVLAYLSQVLCRRLASAYRGEDAGRPTTVVTVAADMGLEGSSLVASTLAHLLGTFTGREVVHVTVTLAPSPTENVGLRERIREGTGGNPAEVELEVTEGEHRHHYGDRLAEAVMLLGDLFPFVVVDLGSAEEELRAAARDSSDHLVEIVDRLETGTLGRETPGIHPILDLYNRGTERPPVNRSRPYVLPVDPGIVDLPATAAARRLRDDPHSPAASPLHRLARSILGASVGIALGGGAAFGLAHIGVLRVLEDEGVPVDLVAGCSIGSMVALAYAAGIHPEEMVALARRCTSRRDLLAGMDFTLSRPGLMGGDRIVELFAPIVAATPTFRDLERPANAVATDLETGEVVVLGHGRLDVAVRASCSVPMLWSPVRLGGRVLADGGIANPVPVDVVRQMGADLTVAVNVVPPLKQGVETGFQRFFRHVEWLQPSHYFPAGRDLPNTFDTVMNSMQILQYELGRFTSLQADLQINPDLSDFTWSEFYRADELIVAGERAAERVVRDLRRLLDEKTARGSKEEIPSPTAATEITSPEAP